MAFTLTQLKSEIATDKNYSGLDQKGWEEKIKVRDIMQRSQKDFDSLKLLYVRKINAINSQIKDDEEWTGTGIVIAPFDKDGNLKGAGKVYEEYCQKADQFKIAKDKAARLYDKLACILKEEQLRKDGLVVRTGIHNQATYYIDYTNGNDAHDGLSTGNLTVDSTADTTHLTDAALTGANDYINGDFLWNVTRGAGSLISDFDAASDTAILATPIVGMTAGDTYYILKSWKTINKAFTTTVRTAGDIVYIRANQTHDCSAASIVCDEDGDVDLWIKVIGCDATTNDPWNDDSNVDPIIDFGNAAYALIPASDKYWWFENFVFTKSDNSGGCVQCSGGSSAAGIAKFVNCSITNGNSGVVEGLTVGGYCFVILDGCTFSDTSGTAISCSGNLYMYNCTLNGGASKPPKYCISNSGVLYAYNCSFGVTTNFTTAIIEPISCSVYLSNCVYDGTLVSTGESKNGAVFVEDEDAVYGSHSTYYNTGVISKQTASSRSGGGSSYARMISNTYCGPNNPLIDGEPLEGFAKVYLTKDVEYTITVYARTGSAWDSALSASEAFLKCSYLSNAATAARTEINSVQTITNDANWTAFTVTFTPLQTGLAYLWFYLVKYEDNSEYIDVDVFGLTVT